MEMNSEGMKHESERETKTWRWWRVPFHGDARGALIKNELYSFFLGNFYVWKWDAREEEKNLWHGRKDKNSKLKLTLVEGFLLNFN